MRRTDECSSSSFRFIDFYDYEFFTISRRRRRCCCLLFSLLLICESPITCRFAVASTIGVPIVFSRSAIAKKKKKGDVIFIKCHSNFGIDLKVLVHGAVTISNVKIYAFFIYEQSTRTYVKRIRNARASHQNKRAHHVVRDETLHGFLFTERLMVVWMGVAVPGMFTMFSAIVRRLFFLRDFY